MFDGRYVHDISGYLSMAMNRFGEWDRRFRARVFERWQSFDVPEWSMPKPRRMR